ncbi:MAG: hypothetical protein JWM84_1371 [Nocardioides sp.]|nr:hypothetical protein [Nocardioides sp.]
MRLSTFTHLYESTGPFASVLLDVSHQTETGEHEHELRVRAACEQLAEQGAPPSVVESMAERLSEGVDGPAPVARLVVAAPDGVHHDDLAHVQVDDPTVTWAPLPDLTAWLAHRDGAVTFVLALVDHEGGDVALYDSDVPEPAEQESVGGETEFVHQVPVGGWSALHYQHTTENVWARNADAVVHEVVSQLRHGHRLVLLAGDPQSRGLVRDGLADTSAEVVELESGTRAKDGGDEALQQAIREALLQHVVRRRLELAHELRERLGRAYAVATGAHDVADAFVRGQVETLLFDPASTREQELQLSQHPGLQLGAVAVGDDEPLRADQLLVAAAVLTDASLSVAAPGALAGASAAALLRWHQDAEGSRA